MRYFITILLSIQLLYGADTGFLSPSATGEDYNLWFSPSNAFSSNNSWTNTGSYLKQDYYNFSINPQSNWVIVGIEVAIEGSVETEGDNEAVKVELSGNGGTTYTTSAYANTWNTFADVTKTYGGATDLWGKTWTYSEFTDANFRLLIEHINPATNYIYIDHIQVKIYYTLSGEQPTSYGYFEFNNGFEFDLGFSLKNVLPYSSLISESEATLSNLNILYTNDFEASTLGYYSQSNWLSEFNNTAQSGTFVRAQTTIQNATDGRSGKVINFNYPAGSVGCCDDPNYVGLPPPYQPIINGGTVAYFGIEPRDELYGQYWMRWDELTQGWVGNTGGGGKLVSFMMGEWADNPNNDTIGKTVATAGLMFNNEGVPQFYIYWPDSPEPEYSWGVTITWGLNYSGYFPGGINWMWLNDGETEAGGYHSNLTKTYIKYTNENPPHMTDANWHNIGVRCVMNTFDGGTPLYNGILEGFWDGELVITVDSVLFRTDPDLKINTVRLTTFFGGQRTSNNDFTRANTYEMNQQVDNLLFYEYDTTEVNVPNGIEFSDTTRILKLF